MVEIFLNRAELMPADETMEQHNQRRIEENEIVEKDKSGPGGLFKGTFNVAPAPIMWDDEDGVQRCRRCHHEYEGGATCNHCGAAFDPIDDFSDGPGIYSDVSDMESHDFDLDAEVDMDDDDLAEYHLRQGPPAILPRVQLAYGAHRQINLVSSDDDADEADDESDDDAGSLQDFVVDEDERSRRSESRASDSVSHITLSSSRSTPRPYEHEEEHDDSDDSDDIRGIGSYGRRAVRVHGPGRVPERASFARATPSIVSISTSEADDYGPGEYEAERDLRGAGWSPLSHDQESDYDSRQLLANGDEDEEEDSDSNTMTGNQPSDDEEEMGYGERSPTPRFTRASQFIRGPGYGLRQYLSGTNRHEARRRHQASMSLSNVSAEDGEADDDDSGEDDDEEPEVRDRDGDVEMSVSPSVSEQSSSSAGDDRRKSGGYLGPANNVHDVDEESSEEDVRPANRRRRFLTTGLSSPAEINRNFATALREASSPPEYDRHIARAFARHQNALRDVSMSQSPGLADLGLGPARLASPVPMGSREASSRARYANPLSRNNTGRQMGSSRGGNRGNAEVTVSVNQHPRHRSYRTFS